MPSGENVGRDSRPGVVVSGVIDSSSRGGGSVVFRITAAIASVVSESVADDTRLLRCIAHAGSDPRGAIAACVTRSWELLELRPDLETLEERLMRSFEAREGTATRQ